MVSWSGDGLLAGYDPITRRLKPDLYHLATPGSVDLQGVTRLQRHLSAGLSTSLYPNKLQVKCPMTFTSADFAANPSKYLAPLLVIAPAVHFPEGYVPTPTEIFALGAQGKAVARFPDALATTPGTRTYTFQELNEDWTPNNKWWILVCPTAWVPGAPTVVPFTETPLMKGADANVIGRSVSIWSNRTPGKPVITSPADGSIALAGSEFTLTVSPADPDAVAPEDAPKYNDDVNGVEFQYAPAPSLDNPSPVWSPLPFDVEIVSFGPVRYQGWFIRGSRDFNGVAGSPELEALVANLGCTVVAAGGNTPADYQPGKGALPTGEWQIRARTFDYGHAYPNSGTNTSEPGPLGINSAVEQWKEPLKDNYFSTNTSPWSDPIKVSIPTQVPAPTPLSPTGGLAVPEASAVRLSWKYRNTHQPPRAQTYRAVQIRKVGDAEWSTVFDDESTQPFVDLPATLIQSFFPTVEMLPDGDFEGGTLNEMSKFDPASDIALTNVASAEAHSGSRYLRVSKASGVADSLTVEGQYTPPAGYRVFAPSGWFAVPPSSDPSFDPVLTIQGMWLDSEGVPIVPDGWPVTPSPFLRVVFARLAAITGPATYPDDPYAGTFQVDRDGDWVFATFQVMKPADGATLQLRLDLSPSEGTLLSSFTEARFDALSITSEPPDLDDFSLVSGNQYEWRVQATDTDGVESDYSAPARFWMVPVGDSGEVRPIPSETIDGATLGCGTHRVFVYRRGGKVRVGEITNMSHVDWSRVRDDISTAEVVVSGWGVDCGNLLSKLQTWAYELVIFRDNGFSTDRVWEGPITLLTYETDRVTIDAKDVMGYAYRRIIKQQMSDAGSGNGTTVVDRARRVLQNAFAPDDPNVLAYLQVLARDDDAMQYRSTPAYSRTAYEEVDDMAANAGLDYTIVGRSIMLWGTKHRIGTLPEFKDADLGSSPIVSEYGMSMANRYAVSDGNGVWGEATRLDENGEDPIYGLVEMLSSTWASDSEDDTGTYTQEGLQTVIESFESFAERSIADRYPPPVVVRVPDNTTINPDTVISIQHLVPGVVIPLRSSGTLRTVVASQKLDSVKVVEEAGKESVSITLSPFSRDDAELDEAGDE